MKNDTRRVFNKWLENLGHANGVNVVMGQHYTVEPSVQQRLESLLAESSAFLQLISFVPVDELKGEKIGLGVGSTLAGRTDTTSAERSPRDISAMTGRGYECHQTNFDSYITYAKLDTWAKFKDFNSRLAAAILDQQARDRLMIGFNGTSVATTTNRTTNPLLQDVNIGWFEMIRTEAPTQVLDEVVASSGKVKYGPAANADYKTLDALFYDAIELLHPTFRDDARLRAIVGRSLMHDKLFPLVNDNSGKPTEANAMDSILSAKRLGGLQGIQAPYIPDGSALITIPANLGLYYQMGARRRNVIDNPKRDRIETYDSSNEAYVVEEYAAAVLIENIEFVE